MSTSNASKTSGQKADTKSNAGTAPDSAAATPTPPAPATPGAVNTPPGGPKADDAVPGTVVGQLGYDTKMVDALLDERAGYVAAGRTERVTAVDKQLAGYGTTAEEAAKERAARNQREASATAASDEKDRQRAKMVDALLDERESYVRRDMTDRVQQVDESLKELGTTHAEAAREREARQSRDAAPDAQRSQQQTR